MKTGFISYSFKDCYFVSGRILMKIIAAVVLKLNIQIIGAGRNFQKKF
jgi:hypothetical protein